MIEEKRKKDVLKRFGKRLSELRKKQKLSLRKLSALCEVDHSDLKKYEDGMVAPTVVTIVDLASGLNVHPKELLDFDLDPLKKDK